MTPEQITNELNALINEAISKGGFVHVVDKKQNRFFLRLSEEVKIVAWTPKEATSDES
jgi:hypothetical protein